MLSLGSENSAKVMSLLGEGEVTQITAEIVKAGQISRDESTTTLEEFATLLVAGGRVASGGPEAARGMLEASLGPERAAAILEGLYQSMVKGPFDFLKNADPRQILNFLSAEHPQTIALVVAHAHPDIAAQVVGGLAEDVQRAVSVRIAMLEPSSPEVIAQVEAMLERRLSSSVKNQETSVADGVQTLIEILNRSDRATERSIFEGLDDHNGELADEVRSRMFVFEDIVTLDDRSGRIEASLFAEAFASNQALLQSDALVVVEGEVSNDDFSGGLRLRAKRVMSLEEARTGLADSLRLKVTGEALKGDRLRWLAELCSKHKGACPVTVDYSGEEARALLQFGDAWRIDPADTLIQALRDQFGRDNVFLHYR
jgi:flagellar motor switch protein FliG